MSDKTLYLVQSTASNTTQCIQQLQLLLDSDDAVVLMGDSVLALNSTDILQFSKPVYVLDLDLQLLPQAVIDEFSQQLTVIDYSGFTDLVLNFKRCISLK